jgi:hypothetical protein
VNVDALIRKGRSSPATPAGKTPVLLRIPASTLAQVDELAAARKVPTPRHTWILEAIQEKIERKA